MFSIRQKRDIAEKIQRIIRETAHPELPDGEIEFTIQIKGRAPWSFAEIKNNGAVPNPAVNPWNESLDNVGGGNVLVPGEPTDEQLRDVERELFGPPPMVMPADDPKMRPGKWWQISFQLFTARDPMDWMLEHGICGGDAVAVETEN